MIRTLRGNFIDKKGIQCLKNYAYKGSDWTILDKALQPWWNYFVELVPLVSVEADLTAEYRTKRAHAGGAGAVVFGRRADFDP